ncbi:MFS transporter [Sanguibacter antarcticus]|uniref:Sugar phosphate permease n=1 Tax=Sanguibacter antarcticus TaxID=372484 RepID=A0A2A9E8B1_9MICO|nr:MFS transporter [Sanguibacter antarcticus]PFG34462.1 sugar phosphate permease [Sanguibacter antarcticus]
MTTADHAPAPLSRALLVWGTAIVAYIVAILHRTSLGVAGIDAVERFHATAAVLSLFVVVQLVVYAAAQIPVGVVLDRLGPRKLIATGAALMAVGQLGMALAESVPLAIVARVLIGAGDAMTFVSLLRLLPSWFSPRRVPLFTQLTGILGQLGQVASALPFVYLLHEGGWTTAFTTVAVVGAVAAVLVVALVRDRPAPPAPGEPHEAPHVVHAPRPDAALVDGVLPDLSLRAVLRTPGSWLGFWTHQLTAFSLTTFVLLWGYPFLVLGQGLTPQEAGALLTLNVIIAIVAGPLLGEFTARRPARRSRMILVIAVLMVVAWASVLVPATPRPMWQLVIFIVLLSLGGPASMMGFDFVRTSNPPGRLGAATGLANMGGFLGALVTTFAIGLVLDVVRPDGRYVLDDFRIALSVIAVPFAVGFVGLLVSRRAVWREMGRLPPARGA